MLEGLDYLVLGGYLCIVAAIGLFAGRTERNTKDYFLGGRSVPFWAAGLSIIATETSALTFIGVPVQAMVGDWTYLQLAFGSILARFIVAWLLIPAYYRAQVFTVYGWLEQRFGVMTKNAASALFFVGRSLASGVRLYAAALAFQVVVPGADLPLVVAVIACVAVAYSAVGGIKAVIWTDVMQGVLLFGGGGIALFFLLSSYGGCVSGAIDVLSATVVESTGRDKLAVFNLGLDFSDGSTLIGGIFGVTFLTMATHGTDQDMVQRALTCRDERSGRASLFVSAALNIPIVVLFLAVGSALWLHYGAGLDPLAGELAAKAGESSVREGYRYVFPYYVVDALPAGVKGLILAGLFAAAMSSLDSAITALSSTAVKNVWEPYVQPGRDEDHYLKVGRAIAVFFGIVLVGIALLVWVTKTEGTTKQGFGILILGLEVLSWIFPPLLGVFLVGVLTPRGSDGGNLIAVGTGIGVLLFVKFWPFADTPPFAWVWNSLIGCVLAFGIAVLFPGRRPGQHEFLGSGTFHGLGERK